ncbi:hypothetical protein [Nereida sp. MMG025]|uniref:hypothetical protein n=1 Tax=Nereida sp. MMG025 TaxID=2909981 RepID=UPI001F32594F|nr:hypothetical protein [Nereida sp. MMG025]MCF6446152.1 hypothetical protein [Nereida sp. MMG025]
MNVFQRSLPKGLRRSSLVTALLVAIFTSKFGFGLIFSTFALLCVYLGIYLLVRGVVPRKAILKGGKLHAEVKIIFDHSTDQSVEWFLWEAEIRHILRDAILLTFILISVLFFVNFEPENAWLLFIGAIILSLIGFRFVAKLPNPVVISDPEKEVFVALLKAKYPDWVVG